MNLTKLTAAAVFGSLAAACLLIPAAGGARKPVKPGIPAAAPPPPVVIGADTNTHGKPRLLVDAAGTAYITYQTGPSATGFCRLKRGGKSCEPLAKLDPFPAAGGASSEDLGDEGAAPLAIGNQLLLYDQHSLYPVVTPEKVTTSGGSFLYTSEDAGATFTGPGMVGTLQKPGPAGSVGATLDGAIAYREGGTPKIGGLYDAVAVGGIEIKGASFAEVFQGVSAGAFTSKYVVLGTTATTNDTVDFGGGVAVDGIRPVVFITKSPIVGSPGGTVTLREFSGHGDVNDASNWSSTSFPGSHPQIAGGEKGAAILYLNSKQTEWMLRRITDGKLSPAGIPVMSSRYSEFAGGLDAALTEDSTGRVVAGFAEYNLPDESARIVVLNLRRGTKWSNPQTIVTFGKDANHWPDPDSLAIGDTGDGGGFATYSFQNGSAPKLDLGIAEFGSRAPTGKKGLGGPQGSTTGTGTGSGGTSGSTACKDIQFGDVEAIAEAGCFLRDPDDPEGGAEIARGEIQLNGLELVPDADVTIKVDPHLHTISSSGTVSVVLRAPGIGDITIARQTLNFELGDAIGDGQTLFDFDTSKFPVDLEGFGIQGQLQVQLTKGGVRIPITVSLPPYLGGVTGSATLIANNTDGLVLDSLHIGVADLVLPGLEVKDLAIDYTKTGDVWKGGATLIVPPGSPFFSIQASVEFDKGDLTSGSFQFSFFPGVPLFTDVYFYSFGGGFDLHPPKSIHGDVVVGAIQQPPSSYAVTVTGKFGITFGSPIVITVGGTAALEGQDIANANATITTDGFFELDGGMDFAIAGTGIQGGMKLVVDPGHGVYLGSINGKVTVFGQDFAGAQAVVSSLGIGACVDYLGAEGGFSYRWHGGLQVMFPTCDVGSLAAVPLANTSHTTRNGTGTPGARVPVPGGIPFEDILVTGKGASPHVQLIDPRGHRVAVSTRLRGARAVALPLTKAHQTLVALIHPRAGTWRVVQAPGSTAIVSVRAARGYPAPAVHATVTGKGLRRTLRYRIAAPPKTTVHFFEQRAKGVFAQVGATRRAHGKLSFRPAPGPGGLREIVALVQGPNVSPERFLVAHYVAPKPVRPGRAKAVIRREGRLFVIHIPRVSGAESYVVKISTSDGRRFLRAFGSVPKNIEIARVGGKDRVTVVVTAFSSGGLAGPPARTVGPK